LKSRRKLCKDERKELVTGSKYDMREMLTILPKVELFVTNELPRPMEVKAKNR